jgi:hypothetical protein
MQIALGEKAQGKMRNVHIFNNLHFTPSVSLYPFVTKETPILTGADADRFISEMGRVDSLSKEERAANRKKLSEEFKAAMTHITLCL